MIKEIQSIEEVRSSADVLRESFGTVASQFGLTFENCPTNSAFIKEESLIEDMEKGIYMFGLFEDIKQCGFVALEKSTESVYYLEKLAVLPTLRHKGYGKLLMDYSFNFVKKQKGEKISIGIINENIRLKNWYINYGFVETGTKVYPHLPFTVCFLEKQV